MVCPWRHHVVGGVSCALPDIGRRLLFLPSPNSLCCFCLQFLFDWSLEEAVLVRTGIRAHGHKWARISAEFLPHRGALQISDFYRVVTGIQQPGACGFEAPPSHPGARTGVGNVGRAEDRRDGRVCGFVALWLCGCVAVWLCGYVAV